MKSALPPPSLKPETTSWAEYQQHAQRILFALPWLQIHDGLKLLRDLKARGGRLFILGVGGSAANASHAVNDFRKIAGIEAYAPTDNVAELTARTNDETWAESFHGWLHVSKFYAGDVLLVLSVGGGSNEVSPNITLAVKYASHIGADILGIVGPQGGATDEHADVCVKIPAEAPYITPLVESFQPLIWHYWVNAL